ncbi:MAG: hypothetical protein NC344_02000 [Bacteroidales bacterium]|nr:hypothetical protein [Bacteroidales bacterium]MCM1146605.1 hypothetical protein [Bacteroidales bacterium]MCM1205997.1 hypothetical protein [Bacillota bacterium]MCM1510121.1 hypothetical protein [Clostridium sp.]
MSEKKLIPVARMLSLLFTPFYLPLVGMIGLFTFSYLSLLPWQYKMHVIIATYFFTILLPTVLIRIYRRYHGWSLYHLRKREKRMVPYIISILSYLACYNMMKWMHFPHFMSSIIVAALFVQIVCALFNNWLKVSTHMAAIGGMAGGVAAFSFIFGFNPTWWLSTLIIIAGLLGTSRMLLRLHTLSEICTGFIVGFITTFIAVLII